jgi:hypothetical protein
MFRMRFLILGLGLALATGTANAQLPATGPTATYGGAQLDGLQCVPAARGMAVTLLRRTLPNLGNNGGAALLWTVNLPGWAKISNDGRKLPPARGSLIIWSGNLPGSGGAGHVAYCIGTVDPVRRIVRVVDSNWYRYPNGTPRGYIHDVPMDYVLGWIVPN